MIRAIGPDSTDRNYESRKDSPRKKDAESRSTAVREDARLRCQDGGDGTVGSQPSAGEQPKR